MERVGFFTQSHIQHECRDHEHPESSKRLSLIQGYLKNNSNLSNIMFKETSEIIEGCVEKIHEPKYIQKIRSVSKKVKNSNWYLDRGDTYVDTGTYDAAYLAASIACSAIKEVTDGKLNHAFCAVRPPGHHASKGEAAGFCIFNNLAVAAKFFLSLSPEKKVLVVDWDTHFGNGTFSTLKNLESVYFFDISTINFPPSQKKAKRGSDSRHSLIQISRSANQDEYLEKFSSEIKRIEDKFRPDIILVSAGFDTHKDDPMHGFSLNENAYFNMTKNLMDSFANVPIISVLEGGYSPRALALSIEQHLLALASND